jgi:ribose-phosphate pyrophosphokinase
MVTALRSQQLVLLTGSANPALAASVARAFGMPLAACLNRQFPDGERHLELHDSVRGCDVFIIQPTSPPVADHLVELLLLADACRRAGAGRVTAVMPYYGYARHDRRATGREPIGARLIADVLAAAGIDRVVAVDLHTPATEAFFSVPVEHVSAVDLLANGLGRVPENAVVVAPDLGAVRLAERYASLLQRPMATILKTRLGPEAVEVRQLVGDVVGRMPIIVDDMISTGHTVAAAVRALLAANCEPDVTVVVSHGLFVGEIDRVLAGSPIGRIVTTDTIPPRTDLPLPVRVVSVAPIVVDVIGRLHRSESLNEILVHQ